tara:strand:- start:4338 stop:5369 length:1032 start_codon:yes stop_codon:yes gene_type:complete
MKYTKEQILSEHSFAKPNIMAGYELHGGLDVDGNYISPRTLKRWEAVNVWTKNLENQGHQLLDCSVEILKHDNFPNLRQAEMLLNLGEGKFFWDSLTITGIIEARGRALAEVIAPDFQEIIEEDISGTCLGHMNEGLFIAHGYDEGGDPDSNLGAHDQMWFAARDLLFGVDAFPIPEVPESIGRPADDRDMPQIPLEFEGILQLLMNVLMIEIRAESFFSFSMDLAKAEGTFLDRKEDAIKASEMISRIRQDEAIHVAYLNLIVSEFRNLTIKTVDGKKLKGKEIIDPFWKKMVVWHGEEVHKESVDIRTKDFKEIFQRINNKEMLIKEFNGLSSDPSLYAIS